MNAHVQNRNEPTKAHRIQTLQKASSFVGMQSNLLTDTKTIRNIRLIKPVVFRKRKSSNSSSHRKSSRDKRNLSEEIKNDDKKKETEINIDKKIDDDEE